MSPKPRRRALAALIRVAATTMSIGVAGVAAAQNPHPEIDNARVAVFRAAGPLPASPHDFVTISSAGAVAFGHKGEAPGPVQAGAVVIELKDSGRAVLANTSGYPNAFPRAHARKLLENDRVIVWSYRWLPGKPTPMHFHDKDTVVVFQDDTTLTSTTPDGKSVTSRSPRGEISFNPRGRIHFETLVRGSGPGGSGGATITELK
jgi:hypothetical protein